MRNFLEGVGKAARLSMCLALLACGTAGISCGKKEQGPPEAKGPKQTLVIGFAQLGSESDWRVANTASIKAEAEKRGATLRLTDAQGDQKKQISALRSFVDQGVDVIAFAPKVETGFEPVLREIKKAGIPVILTDRGVDVTDHSLYVTFIGSDFVEEGRRAAKWLIENTQGQVNVAELQGTPGASCANDRKKGFEEAIKDHSRIKIILSQDGDFRRDEGMKVMQSFLKTPEGKQINAVYAHNDNMALGAIKAIKEAGLKPGKDIKIVSIDAVKDALKAIIAGELNCSVECSPLLGPKLFDIAEALVKKRLIIQESVFDQSNAKDAIGSRQY